MVVYIPPVSVPPTNATPLRTECRRIENSTEQFTLHGTYLLGKALGSAVQFQAIAKNPDPGNVRSKNLGGQILAVHESGLLGEDEFSRLLDAIAILLDYFPLSAETGYLVDCEEADEENDVPVRGILQIRHKGERPFSLHAHFYANRTSLYIRDGDYARYDDDLGRAANFRNHLKVKAASLAHGRHQTTLISYAG